MKQRVIRRNAAGLSLVEILVAISIISIVFMALAFSQLTGFRVTRAAKQDATATDLASKQFAQIRSYGFNSYANCPAAGPENSNAPDCSGSVTPAEFPNYQVAWTVSNAPAGVATVSEPALVQVAVTVRRDDSSYSLSSYLSCADAGEFSSNNVPCPTESLIPTGGL